MWIALVASWRDRLERKKVAIGFESRFRFAFRPWGPMLVRSIPTISIRSPERSWNWAILPLPLSLPLLLSFSEVCIFSKSDQIVYP